MDLPSGFIHNPMDPKDPKVHITLHGKLTESMVKFDPKLYREIVSPDRKGPMAFYVEIQKSLYRIIKSALLFYQDLVVGMKRAAFKLNTYDLCVMNKIVRGNHMSVVFHIDDMKVSYKSDKAVKKVIEYLNGVYPGLKAVRVDVHDYLGVIFD